MRRFRWPVCLVQGTSRCPCDTPLAFPGKVRNDRRASGVEDEMQPTLTAQAKEDPPTFAYPLSDPLSIREAFMAIVPTIEFVNSAFKTWIYTSLDQKFCVAI